MSFAGLIRHPRLSRLLAVRWTGQMTDGVFQSALASFVLFSPERQANALSAAIGFAVVLLPYSIVGPFVGTILDRVSRQRALFFSGLLLLDIFINVINHVLIPLDLSFTVLMVVFQ